MFVAQLETPKVVHTAIWIRGYEENPFDTDVVTLCGWRKKRLKGSPKLIYPGYESPSTKPACKLCENVLSESAKLLPALV